MEQSRHSIPVVVPVLFEVLKERSSLARCDNYAYRVASEEEVIKRFRTLEPRTRGYALPQGLGTVRENELPVQLHEVGKRVGEFHFTGDSRKPRQNIWVIVRECVVTQGEAAVAELTPVCNN